MTFEKYTWQTSSNLTARCTEVVKSCHAKNVSQNTDTHGHRPREGSGRLGPDRPYDRPQRKTNEQEWRHGISDTDSASPVGTASQPKNSEDRQCSKNVQSKTDVNEECRKRGSPRNHGCQPRLKPYG